MFCSAEKENKAKSKLNYEQFKNIKDEGIK